MRFWGGKNMGIMYNPTLNFRKHFFSKGEFFFQTGTLFHKVNFFSRAARYSPAHESWELVPLDELSLSGILQRWNQRFQVSGMRRRSNPCWHLVIARRDNAVAIQASGTSLRARRSNLVCVKRIASPLRGSQ